MGHKPIVKARHWSIAKQKGRRKETLNRHRDKGRANTEQ